MQNKISKEIITNTFTEHIRVIEDTVRLQGIITEAANAVDNCLQHEGKVLLMGNGGSAADAQHLAAEFIGRFTRERQALPGIALTTDSSILTALANDYSYEQVFARQIDGLCRQGDVVIGISTSGNSPNVLAAIKLAQDRGAVTIGLSGGATGGSLNELVDISLHVKSNITARVQEAHILIGHIICDLVEAAACERDSSHV